MFKRILTPAVLLALAVSFVATASPKAQVAAAPRAAVVQTSVQAPTAVAPASVATHAVATPANLAFAKGAQGLSPKVLAMALDAVACAKSRGLSGRDDLLTVIDYTLPSTEPRLWVLDLAKGEVLYRELVAHGQGSGENYATRFSNQVDSHQTSLGLFLTSGTYEGGNGYSLKLRGLDEGVNDRAEARHIVIHGAWYVSADHVKRQGRLGRSHGCPALSQASARTVIDTIKGGSFVFSYSGKDEGWYQKASSSLGSCQDAGAESAVAASAAG